MRETSAPTPRVGWAKRSVPNTHVTGTCWARFALPSLLALGGAVDVVNRDPGAEFRLRFPAVLPAR
jgi:hypothetical protein